MKEGGYIKTLEDKYRKAARAKYHDCGVIEVDPDAKLSAAVSVIGDEGAGGCYVQVWAWVDAADLEEEVYNTTSDAEHDPDYDY